MLATKPEESDMYEKEFESRITRLETLNENINTTLLDLKNGLREVKDEIKSLRNEGVSQTRWILGFIFLILGSPIFSAIVTKLSAWAHP